MRHHRFHEAHAVGRVGARQRDAILHGGVRHQLAVVHVLLDRVGQRADQTQPPRDPAHAAIEAPRQRVEGQPMIFVQRAEQPTLLERAVGRVRAQQLPKDQRLGLRHLPDHGRDRVALETPEAADALVAVHHHIREGGRHDHDRHLLARVRQRGQEASLARWLPDAQPFVPQIQLMKFQLHRPRPGPSRAPDVPNRPTPPAQLRTRPPTDDAALAKDRPPHDRRHRGESVESSQAEGTLIHHATARAIGPLMVAMIEPSFRTLLMAPARRAD